MLGYSNRLLFSTIIGGALLIGSSIPLWNYLNDYFFPKKRDPAIVDKKDVIVVLSHEETYIEKCKTAFIRSYQEKNGDVTYNSNLDERFFSKELYDKAMSEQNSPFELEWRKRICMEYTPRGNIIMYYDAYKRAFAYYADISISYAVLNAVAMKYVSMYKCRYFFIDEGVCSDVSKSPFLHVHEIEDVKKEKKDNIIDVKKGPFLQPKPKGVKGNVDQPRITKALILCKNKFVCVGKIRNFSILDKPAGSVSILKKNANLVDYGSFKAWRNMLPTKGDAPLVNSFSATSTNQ